MKRCNPLDGARGKNIKELVHTHKHTRPIIRTNTHTHRVISGIRSRTSFSRFAGHDKSHVRSLGCLRLPVSCVHFTTFTFAAAGHLSLHPQPL